MSPQTQRKEAYLFNTGNGNPSNSTNVPFAWTDADNVVNVKAKITSALNQNTNPYFEARVNFRLSSTSATVTNIEICDINFEDPDEVSLTDRTDDYYYLYDIDSSEECSTLFSLGCSESLSSIVDKNTRKAIQDEVKKLVEAFGVAQSGFNGTLTINRPAGSNLTNIKFDAFFKENFDSTLSTEICETLSSESSASSTCKVPKKNDKLVKLLLALVGLYIVLSIVNKDKANKLAEHIKQLIHAIINKVKEILDKIFGKHKCYYDSANEHRFIYY
jgi:predicted XRE-type DNA-binding protein